MAKKKIIQEPSISDVLVAINGLTQAVSQLVQQKQSVPPQEDDFEDETGVTVSVKPKRGRPKQNKQPVKKQTTSKISPTLGKPRINKFEEMDEKEAFNHEIDKKKWKPKKRGPIRSLKYKCSRCDKEEFINKSMIGPNGEYKCSNCVGKK